MIDPIWIEKFSRDTLEKLSLSSAIDNYLLALILYTTMIALGNRLSEDIQYRYVKMIAYGLSKFSNNAWIQMIFAKFIFRWQRYHKKFPQRN